MIRVHLLHGQHPVQDYPNATDYLIDGRGYLYVRAVDDKPEGIAVHAPGFWLFAEHVEQQATATSQPPATAADAQAVPQ